jgi:hypothetical protein
LEGAIIRPNEIVDFLLANRHLGEQLQAYPGRFFFPTGNLPPLIQKTINPAHVGLILLQDLDESWYIFP